MGVANELKFRTSKTIIERPFSAKFQFYCSNRLQTRHTTIQLFSVSERIFSLVYLFFPVV